MATNTRTRKAEAEAQPYAAHVGNKALAGSSVRVIAAQHAAASTTHKAGVPLADMPIRAIAAGFDLRAIGYVTADATYSTRQTPTSGRTAIGAVHTFRHAASIAKGSPVACDALHKGANGPCSATAPNMGADVRTYRCDSGADHKALASVLDSPTLLAKAAAQRFEALVSQAVAAGYSDVARLAVTPGIVQLLEHPTHGAAMRAAFAKATQRGKAKRTSTRTARAAKPASEAVAPASEASSEAPEATATDN